MCLLLKVLPLVCACLSCSSCASLQCKDMLHSIACDSGVDLDPLAFEQLEAFVTCAAPFWTPQGMSYSVDRGVGELLIALRPAFPHPRVRLRRQCHFRIYEEEGVVEPQLEVTLARICAEERAEKGAQDRPACTCDSFQVANLSVEQILAAYDMISVTISRGEKVTSITPERIFTRDRGRSGGKVYFLDWDGDVPEVRERQGWLE